MRVLITGGAGFIGSAVARRTIAATDDDVLVFDKLTYAGSLDALAPIAADARFAFRRGDVCDRAAVDAVIAEFRPDVIMHLAAETHVDRSIDGPAAFIETNVVGTCVMLDAALAHYRRLSDADQRRFRFLHTSTDEVFGTLDTGGAFRENTPYAPSSPYSATKASADHLVRAWHTTFGLPTLVTNGSNTYGPYHYPEKLIPLAILNAREGKPISVYGDGRNVRDWLYVDDHAAALLLVAKDGAIGHSYNVGSRTEMTNLQVVEAICDQLDDLLPQQQGVRRALIRFVADRPGHDRRYAVDPSKIERDLGWRPDATFETGLRKTIRWFLDNEAWWRPIRDIRYAGERLGTIA